MLRERADIERDLANARAREAELVAEHERSLTDVRGRIAEFEAELGLAAFEATPGPAVFGCINPPPPVRTIKSACDLNEAMTGAKCPRGCRSHHGLSRLVVPVTLYPFRLVPRSEAVEHDPNADVAEPGAFW